MNFDDDVYVYRNERVLQGASLSSAAWFFSNVACNFYHPLTMLSFVADATCHGAEPWGYHLTNLLLHAGTVVGLFLALREMSGTVWRSAFVAALFGVHPLRVESVVWISERKDVLCGLFFVLTLLAYVRYARAPSARKYLGVVSLFVLALLAKPSVVTLPFLLLLLDGWPLRRVSFSERPDFANLARLVLEKIPLLFFSVLACVVAIGAQGECVIPAAAHSWAARCLHVPVAYSTYLLQTVRPAGLAPFYPLEAPGLLEAAGGLLLVGALSLLAVLSAVSRPWIFVGWFWFLGMLVPMIGLVQVGSFAHADRFTYFPQIGLLIAGTWTFWEFVSVTRRGRLIAVVTALSILAVSVLLTARQTAVWKNSETLFRHTLAVTDRNAVGHFNLGVALEESGRATEALEHYRKAVALWPGYPHAHLNLGLTLASQQRPAEAIPYLQKALRDEPENTNALVILGICLAETGLPDLALTALQKARHLQPRNPEIAFRLGSLLRRQGQISEAIAQYEAALALDPALADGHNSLAVALCQSGREREALPHFQESLRLKPENPDARRNLEMVLAQNPGLAVPR